MGKLDQIKKEIFILANKINAPVNLIPNFGISNDEAHPFIELDNSEFFNLVVRERGKEHERKVYSDKTKLIEKVFEGITFLMATDFELKNRIENQDFRIILFAKQEELLNILSDDWAKKQKERNQKYLNN